MSEVPLYRLTVSVGALQPGRKAEAGSSSASLGLAGRLFSTCHAEYADFHSVDCEPVFQRISVWGLRPYI